MTIRGSGRRWPFSGQSPSWAAGPLRRQRGPAGDGRYLRRSLVERVVVGSQRVHGGLRRPADPSRAARRSLWTPALPRGRHDRVHGSLRAMCGGAVACDPDRGPHRPGGGRRGHRPDLPWPSPAGLPGETTQHGGGTVGWFGRGRRDAGPDCRWAASRRGLAVDLSDQRADRAAHRGVRRPCGATSPCGYGIPSPGPGFDGVPVDGDHRVRPCHRRRPRLGMALQSCPGAVCRCGRGCRAHCAAVGHPPIRTD